MSLRHEERNPPDSLFRHILHLCRLLPRTSGNNTTHATRHLPLPPTSLALGATRAPPRGLRHPLDLIPQSLGLCGRTILLLRQQIRSTFMESLGLSRLSPRLPRGPLQQLRKGAGFDRPDSTASSAARISQQNTTSRVRPIFPFLCSS